MTNQKTFTPKDRRLALAVLGLAVIVVAATLLLNPRPYLGAYENLGGAGQPAGVMDARPIGSA